MSPPYLPICGIYLPFQVNLYVPNSKPSNKYPVLYARIAHVSTRAPLIFHVRRVILKRSGLRSSHTRKMAGHRGLPSAKLFSDLDQIVEGDTFTLNIMDQTITYMVDQIRIVLPEETDELAITDGKDYCTLVTCTPYGVNTHRMLVRGKRIDNIIGEVVVVSEAVRIPNYIVAPAICIPLLFIILLIMLIYYRRLGPRKTEAELLDEMRKL